MFRRTFLKLTSLSPLSLLGFRSSEEAEDDQLYKKLVEKVQRPLPEPEPAPDIPDSLYEGLTREYEPKAHKFLAMLAEMLEEEGFLIEGPWEMGCEDPQWTVIVRVGPREVAHDMPLFGEKATEHGPHDVDVSISMLFATTHGDGGEFCLGEGVTFRIDMVEYGGRIIGGCCPWNHTDKCWVDASDPEQVEKRWRELIPEETPHYEGGELQASEIVYILEQHREEVEGKRCS